MLHIQLLQWQCLIVLKNLKICTVCFICIAGLPTPGLRHHIALLDILMSFELKKIWEYNIIMCQQRFANCNKCTPVVWGIDSGQLVPGWEHRVYETSVLIARFCSEHKNGFKNKVY